MNSGCLNLNCTYMHRARIKQDFQMYLYTVHYYHSDRPMSLAFQSFFLHNADALVKHYGLCWTMLQAIQISSISIHDGV